MAIDLNKMRAAGYIIQLNRREYTTHPGLLATAHDNGLTSISIELVSWDAESRQAVMKATATGERGTYSDYGDADPSNVNKNIATACIRMASTRASSRALRLYLGVGMACLDELPGKDEKEEPAPNPEPEPAAAPEVEEKHPSWEKDRRAFFKALTDMGWDYDVVKYLLASVGGRKPSLRDTSSRTKLLAYLRKRSAEDRDHWHASYSIDVEGAPADRD